MMSIFVKPISDLLTSECFPDVKDISQNCRMYQDAVKEYFKKHGIQTDPIRSNFWRPLTVCHGGKDEASCFRCG